jgi:hypothetical protein
MRVRMNVLPKRASTLRIPEPLVSPIQPIPAEVFVHLCAGRACLGGDGERTSGARAGGHLLLVVVRQHMMSRAYCPPPPPPPNPPAATPHPTPQFYLYNPRQSSRTR